jgi:hypothetical protein
MVRSLFALAVVLSVASAGLAGDLATPSVFVGLSPTIADCRLTNLTSAPISAQLEMLDSIGYVGATSGPITVLAGRTADVSWQGPNGLVYCRFVNASKSKVRADIAVEAANGDQLVVPAQ